MRGHTYKNCNICGVVELLHNKVDTCGRCREKECLNCGEIFTVKGKKDGDKKYCGLRCASIYRSNQKIEKKCKECSKEFVAIFNRIYCDECVYEKKRQSDADYRKKQGEKLKQKKRDQYRVGVIKICENCDKEYERANWTKPNYCSTKCYHKKNKTKRKGKGNPNWKKGKASQTYNKMYAEWVYKNKGLLLEELGCEVCKQTSGCIFDRHHIIFKSEKGWHDEINNPRNTNLPARIRNPISSSEIFLSRIALKKRRSDMSAPPAPTATPMM